MTNFDDLEVIDTIVGDGKTVKPGDVIQIHYSGKLTNGYEFDSSNKRGIPLDVAIGVGELIKGWDIGIIGMKVGGKRTLKIPYKLAYGERGIPSANIPPKSDMIFDVELIDIL
jgi:peptidylprolyl isomerase